MDHHYPLGHRIDGKRDDHRRDAQVGDTEAVDEPQRDAAEDTERDRNHPTDSSR